MMADLSKDWKTHPFKVSLHHGTSTPSRMLLVLTIRVIGPIWDFRAARLDGDT